MSLFNISAKEYYVIVFDVCSSSTILEELQRQDKLKVWRKFWSHIHFFLGNTLSRGAKCIVYKFVGDGFILLYRSSFINELIPFCERIAAEVNKGINSILDTYGHIENRTGVTFGIEKGSVIMMRLNGQKEYMGKAMNVASRLQGLLKLPSDANHLLVSETVKNDIATQLEDRPCVVRNEELHNLNDGKPFTCYEIEMK